MNDNTLRVEAKFKNARLFNAIAASVAALGDEAMAYPVKVFCTLHGLSLQGVRRLLNLSRGPFLCGRGIDEVVTVRPLCAKLVALLERDVEWLFPRDLYSKDWRTTFAVDVPSEYLALGEAPTRAILLEATQERALIGAECRNAINVALASLTQQEALVITMRYGLDWAGERTHREIGKAIGVGNQKVARIEGNALWKLRQPGRSRKLSEYEFIDAELIEASYMSEVV